VSELIKTEAIVLSTTRWHESSKIIHLFSRDAGDIKVLAKGALRPKSPFRGVLEAMNHAEVIISHRESRSLQILTSATLLNAFLNIREDLKKTAVGYSILELLKKLFPVHEPVKDFFEYLISLLSALNQSSLPNPEPFLWHFLFRLSETLGFGWHLAQCQGCRQPPARFPVALDTQKGGIFCPPCQTAANASPILLEEEQWKVLWRFINSPPDTIEHIVDKNFTEFYEYLNDILLKHLMYHTDIPLELNSLKWYM